MFQLLADASWLVIVLMCVVGAAVERITWRRVGDFASTGLLVVAGVWILLSTLVGVPWWQSVATLAIWLGSVYAVA